MDGGLLSWRTQTIVNNCPDIIEACSKSLPAPPSGWFWERSELGDWVLMELPSSYATEGVLVFTKPSIIEHVVMPSDTLQGICLRYRVSAVTLRRANLFSGDNIRFKSTLLIPINEGAIINPQIETHEVILQRFKNVTGEENAEARVYLDDCEWNFDAAVTKWKADQEWESQVHAHPVSSPSCPAAIGFSSELPADEVVIPLSVEVPKLVTPLSISLFPPTFTKLFSRRKNNITLAPAEVVEVSEPFL